MIAFWDFNDGFSAADESVQITHLATIGSGTIYQQRADTDGNGKGGVAYANPMLGINAIADRAMAWDDISKSGDNDAEFFVEFSTVGYTDIQVRFDVQGDNDATSSIVAYDMKFDINPLEDVTNPGDVVGTIKDFDGGVSTSIFNNQAIATDGTTFTVQSIDLSGFTAMNNQGTVALRIDDLDGNDSLRFDNFLVTGVSAVPEPSVAGLLSLGLLGAFSRRRQRRV